MKRKGITGLKLSHFKVQENYSSLAELRAFDSVYKIARRCGFRSALALWKANPMLQCSVNPDDFGVAK